MPLEFSNNFYRYLIDIFLYPAVAIITFLRLLSCFHSNRFKKTNNHHHHLIWVSETAKPRAKSWISINDRNIDDKTKKLSINYTDSRQRDYKHIIISIIAHSMWNKTRQSICGEDQHDPSIELLKMQWQMMIMGMSACKDMLQFN